MKSLPYIIVGLLVVIAGWLIYTGKLSFSKAAAATTKDTPYTLPAPEKEIKTVTKTVFVKSDPIIITKYIDKIQRNKKNPNIFKAD